MHYSNIFDVMVQHHPEYVSLAWSTFKLLFVVSIVLSHAHPLRITAAAFPRTPPITSDKPH